MLRTSRSSNPFPRPVGLPRRLGGGSAKIVFASFRSKSMHLAIDPILPGVGSSNWQTNVSVSMADSLSGHTTEGTERILARPWLWARTFTDAALALAKEVSDPIPLAILLRWAARH